MRAESFKNFEEKKGDPLDRFSSSSKSAATDLGLQKRVTSWEIVKTLCRIHPEYGQGLANSLAKESGPAQATTKTPVEWLAAVQSVLIDPEDAIGGRLLILALSYLDHSLTEFSAPTRFLEELKTELKEPYERYFPPSKISSLPRDPTPLRIDDPTVNDELGRNAFARALADRLGRIWNENRTARSETSFVLHVHGPWGSGKSSLLNLLRENLQARVFPNKGRPHANSNADHLSRWIVMEFNAWRQQRLNPP